MEKVLSRAKPGKDFQRRTKKSGSKKAPSKQTEPIYRFSLTLYGAWQSPQTDLILSACSIKSKLVYSVYRFCLVFFENRRRAACRFFILRKYPRLMGYSTLHLRQ